MQTDEIWKDIPSYNSRYQASTLGRIRSTDRTILKNNGTTRLYKGKILKPFMSTGGYWYVTIAKVPNKFIPKRVHRLIAETFIPNPNNYPQINHINEDKADNSVNNLEWCDAKYNSNYGHRIEKFIESNRNNPTLSKEVNQYDLEGNYVQSFPSTTEAARFLGRDVDVTACRICQCCRHLFKKGNSAYGFLWEFSSKKPKGEPIEKLQIGTPVYQYSLDNHFIKKWENLKLAAQTLNLDISNISRACKYHRTCGGFKWSKNTL